LKSAPAVASWGSNRLDVFYRGNDNQLYSRAWDGVRWIDHYCLGGTLTSEPTVVSWGPNRLDVFYRGLEN
jgi:hypothetical protein